jgi:hypothetical protein
MGGVLGNHCPVRSRSDQQTKKVFAAAENCIGLNLISGDLSAHLTFSGLD